jgi:hypothetical protein
MGTMVRRGRNGFVRPQVVLRGGPYDQQTGGKGVLPAAYCHFIFSWAHHAITLR